MQPLSSFELSLFAKHIYGIKIKDYADNTNFMKVELIARTLKDDVMYELRERQ